MAIADWKISDDKSTVWPVYACGTEAPAANVMYHGERYAVTKMIENNERHEYKRSNGRTTVACERCVHGPSPELVSVLDVLRVMLSVADSLVTDDDAPLTFQDA